MGTYRNNVFARLALAGAALAIAACAILLRPPTAAAAPIIGVDRPFTFGPISAGSRNDQDTFVAVNFFNSANRPTPPATLVFRDADDGEIIAQLPIASVMPGKGGRRDPQVRCRSGRRCPAPLSAPDAGANRPRPVSRNDAGRGDPDKCGSRRPRASRVMLPGLLKDEG